MRENVNVGWGLSPILLLYNSPLHMVRGDVEGCIDRSHRASPIEADIGRWRNDKTH